MKEKKQIICILKCSGCDSIRQLQQPLPQHVVKGNKQYHDTITTQLSAVSPDLQDINTHRYARQISGGVQEYIEAASFQHYLETASLLSYDEAAAGLRAISSKPLPSDGEIETRSPGIELSHEDYLLGIYDMTGELMRFAITTMATNQALPTITSNDSQRNVLTDMRALRSALESLEYGTGPFAKDAEKKADVMRSSVEKVERALYGLTVRGAERPKGWMPDLSAGAGAVEVEG